MIPLKRLLPAALILLLSAGARADGLYYVGAEAAETLPLKWILGLDMVYDDHVSAPGCGQSAPVPVGPPPFGDFVSSILQVEFNSYHSPENQQGTGWLLLLLSSMDDEHRFESLSNLFTGTGIQPRCGDELNGPLDPELTEGGDTLNPAGEQRFATTDSSLTLVPEPSAALLGMLGAVRLLRRRR